MSNDSFPIKKIFAKDKKSVYLWSNSAYAHDFNLTSKQIIGKTDFDLYPKALAKKYIADDKKTLKFGQTVDIEEEYFAKGEKHFVHTIKTPSRNSQGYINGIIGVFWDTTFEKEIEKKLIESQKKYKAYVEQAPYGVFVANQKGQYVEVNQTACRQLGYKKEEILKLSIPQIISPRSASVAQKSFSNLLKTGKDESELEFKKKNGEFFWGTVSAVSLSNDLYLGFVHDISDRKKREQEISRLASIVENSQDAIISKTLDGIITSWNQGAKKIYGYNPKETIGKSINLIVPKNKQSELDQILKKIGQGQTVEHLQTERIDKLGRLISISLSVSPIVDQSQKIVGASAISRDISQQIEEEQRLEKINHLMVGRELKMIELKEEIKRLKNEI